MSENINIICVGESLIELSTNESLTYTENMQKNYGGDVITTAVMASRLGSRVGFITNLGNDPFKDYLLESWQMEDVDTGHIKLVEGINGLYCLSVQLSGEKEIAYYKKKTAAATLNKNDIKEDVISKASIVYSTGVTQALSISAAEAVKKAFEIAKTNGCSIAYDPNFRKRLWDIDEAKDAFEEISALIDIVFINARHDGQNLLEITSPDKIIKALWDKGIQTVAVKAGNEGCYVGYNGEINHINSPIVDVVDTTCAGDAFNGAFLYGIDSGYSPFEAAKIAVAASSLHVQKLGAIRALPTKEEVFSSLKSGE